MWKGTRRDHDVVVASPFTMGTHRQAGGELRGRPYEDRAEEQAEKDKHNQYQPPRGTSFRWASTSTAAMEQFLTQFGPDRRLRARVRPIRDMDCWRSRREQRERKPHEDRAVAAAEKAKLRQHRLPTGRPAIHIVLPAFEVYGHLAHQARKPVGKRRLEEPDTLIAERNKRPLVRCRADGGREGAVAVQLRTFEVYRG